jgi:hypothetical protein
MRMAGVGDRGAPFCGGPFTETDAQRDVGRTISRYAVLPITQEHAHPERWAWHPCAAVGVPASAGSIVFDLSLGSTELGEVVAPLQGFCHCAVMRSFRILSL